MLGQNDVPIRGWFLVGCLRVGVRNWASTYLKRCSVFFLIFLISIYGCSIRKPIKRDASILDQFNSESELRAVHYHPISVLQASVGGPLSLEDPIVGVKSQFLSAVGRKLNLNNIRVINEPRFAGSSLAIAAPLHPLKRTFLSGWIFDFDSVEWELIAYPDITFNHPKRQYSLRYVVRARLIFLDSENVIWEGICRVGRSRSWPFEEKGTYEEPPHERQTLEELVLDDNAFLKIKREEAENICSQQLIDQFLKERMG